jgi:hypothetical protein
MATALLCVLLLSLGLVIWAAETVRKSSVSVTNRFIPGTVDIAVVENGKNNDTTNYTETYTADVEWVDATPSENDTDKKVWTATKEVQVKNMAKSSNTSQSAPAYVRVSIIPRWTRCIYVDSEGNIYESLTATENALGIKVTATDIKAKYVDVLDSEYLKDFGDIRDIVINDQNKTFTMGNVTFKLNDSWSDNWIFNPNDGYFYYKKAITPEDESKKILGGITTTSEETKASDGSTTTSEAAKTSTVDTTITTLLLEKVSIPGSIKNKLNEDLFLKVDIVADGIQTEGGALDARWKDSGIVIDEATGELKLKETENSSESQGEAEESSENSGEQGGKDAGSGN